MLRSGGNFRLGRSTAFRPDGSPSETIQSAKDECDINVIVRRFGVTGQVVAPARLPQYGDYQVITDYHSAMNVIREAGESFMELPATIRARFANDPQKFLEFSTKAENLAELQEMGLARKIPKPHVAAEVNQDESARSTGRAAAPRDDASRAAGAEARGESGGARSGDSTQDAGERGVAPAKGKTPGGGAQK